MKTTISGHLQFLPLSLAVAVMAMAGVSCKGTKTTADSGSYDDFYADTGSTGAVGEYDNIYDESGVQKVDDYTGDSSTYEYASGTDYASPGTTGGGTTTAAATYTPPSKPKPKPTPAVASKPTVSKPKPSGSTSGSAKYHVVQKGETLYRLSRNYGTSVTAIQDANNLSDDLIRIGQQLVIPSK